jgi:hypothetical protein
MEKEEGLACAEPRIFVLAARTLALVYHPPQKLNTFGRLRALGENW